VWLSILTKGFSGLWSVLCCKRMYCRGEATEEGRGINRDNEMVQQKNKTGNPSFRNEDRSLQEYLVPSKA